MNVARDGRWREGVTVAAANVEHCSKTPRTPDSFAMCLADVALGESEAKTWLEGVAAVVRASRQTEVRPTIASARERADDTHFPVFATGIHHRIIVEPSEMHNAPRVCGKPSWPAGLWMKQVL